VDQAELNWLSSADSDGDFISDVEEFNGTAAGQVLSWGAIGGIPDWAGNPGTNTTAIAVAAGYSHSMLLRQNGSILAWGGNTYGQTNLSGASGTYMAVAAGERHSLALTEAGVVAGWGDNSFGQLNYPSPNSGFTAIATAYRHNLALRSNGTVAGWGDNTYGQSTVPGGLSGVEQVAAGQDHSLARKSNGTVVAWGRNNYGQTTVPTAASNVVEIAAGYTHSLALRADGKVVGWGDNTAGAATAPAGLSNVLHIAAGYRFSVALKNDGTLVAWGDNSYGQTTLPHFLSDIQAVSAGYRHVASLPRSDALDYPVDVMRDFLVVANSASAASVNVANYYLATRPGMAGCTNLVLVNHSPINQRATTNSVDANIIVPVLTWLTNNPAKRPRYVLLSCQMPQVVAGIYGTNISYHSSLQDRLRRSWPGPRPVIGALNMHISDCTNYINKLSQLGSLVPRTRLVLSASRGGYSNDLLCLDNAKINMPDPHLKFYPVVEAATGLTNHGVPPANIRYAPLSQPPIYSATNVAAYISWGGNAGPPYTNTWSVDGTVVFHGSG